MTTRTPTSLTTLTCATALACTMTLALASATWAEEAPAPAAAPPASTEAAKPSDAAAEDPDASADELMAQETESAAIARDLSPTLKPIYDVGESATGKKIAIDAWVNKKDLSYAIGDTLTVSVKPKEDAYITILNVGSSGKMTVIYPNHFQRDAKVKADTTVRIPSKKQKWQITVGGPAGVDLIKVIASKAPLTLKELQSVAATDEKNPVISLGRSGDEAAKDLTPQLKPESGDGKEASFGVRNILVRVKK